MPHTVTSRFKVGRVIDGDTITSQAIDVGFHIQTTADIEFRFLRCNAPESNRPATKVAGLAAKEYTLAWLMEHADHDPDGWLWATTTKTDSFGRYLAEIACTEGHNLSDALLSSGNAVPFP